MTVAAIDHVQLAMPEGGEAAAQEFYEGLLGLRRVPKPPNLERRGGCWFENANVKVHLGQRGGCWFENDSVKVHLGVDADFRPARKAHPALVVEGLGLLVERLRATGVRVRDDELLAAYVRAYVRQPHRAAGAPRADGLRWRGRG